MSTKSLYVQICENLTQEGRLPRLFELPREATAPNEMKFMVGAKDGIGVFHCNAKQPDKIAGEIVGYLKSGKTDMITPVVNKYGALGIIDALLSAIRENADKLDAAAIVQYAQTLAFESTDEELVKLGIALLGLFDWSNAPEIQKKLITLGLYEEFTLYATVAVGQWNNANDVIFQIAKNVDGWGKIHAVERLEPETEEIRRWILRDGCSNAVVDAYLGLECAVKGDLISALRNDEIDVDCFESISIIIDVLMDEGPVQGISVYEHAEEALFLYLKLAEARAETLKHIWYVLNIETFLEDEDLEISNKEELLRLCAEIKGRGVWHDKIMVAMTSPESENFSYANNVASRLGIDVTTQVFEAVKENPVKNQGYLAKAYRNPDYATELTVLLEKTLPLDEMASGMDDYLLSPTHMQETGCLDFVLQELRSYPLLGELLVKTALLSPVTRNRNGACMVIDAWGEKLGQAVDAFSPTLHDVLKTVFVAEVNEDTKKRMAKLIREERLTKDD